MQAAKVDDMLPSTILAAIANLDQKGTDENISKAMTIVVEAFRFQAAKHPFSAEDLYTAAMYQYAKSSH